MSEIKRTVVMLTNPLGGYNLLHGEAVTALAKEAGISVFEGCDPDQIAVALHTIAAAKPDLLIVNGGDGTVRAVAQAMRQEKIFEKEPMLALLRGGSTNMIQNDVGWKGKPAQAMRRLIARLEQGLEGTHVLSRAPLSVRRADEEGEEYGFFWGAGALPRVTAKTQEGYAQGATRGLLGELFTLLGVMKSLVLGGTSRDPRLAPTEIGWRRADASTAAQASPRLFVFITTLDRLILGLAPGSSGEGLKLVSLRHPHTCRDLLSYLLARGQPVAREGANFEFESGAELALKLTGDWVLDGEFFKGSSDSALLHLKTGKPFRFLCLK